MFDGSAMIRVLDGPRADRGLDWSALADALYQQSSDLNAELADNNLCQGALLRTARRGTMSCQYALIILRWIDRALEDFLTRTAVDVGDTRLAAAGPDKRLRWDLSRLHAALDEHRSGKGPTWAVLAHALDPEARSTVAMRARVERLERAYGSISRPWRQDQTTDLPICGRRRRAHKDPVVRRQPGPTYGR